MGLTIGSSEGQGRERSDDRAPERSFQRHGVGPEILNKEARGIRAAGKGWAIGQARRDEDPCRALGWAQLQDGGGFQIEAGKEVVAREQRQRRARVDGHPHVRSWVKRLALAGVQ